MLILRRKAGEAISIGDDIRIVVVEVKGNQVKLGVEAPMGISIYRDELLAKIRAENQQASKVTPEILELGALKEMFKRVTPKSIETKDILRRGYSDDD